MRRLNRLMATAIATTLTVPLLVLATSTAASSATWHSGARKVAIKTVKVSRARTTPPAPTPTSTPATPASLGSNVSFGAFASGFNGSGTQVAQLERQLGAHLAIASSFRGMGDVFPSGDELLDAATGHSLLISWYLGDTADTRFSTFADGSHDAYLKTVANTARNSGATIYLRPWAEMNGDWTPFQPTADGSRPAGGTPAQFVAAWRHVVDVFRAAGASNVKWVFNPTADTYRETTDVRTIFPGRTYVDVLGLDGYNWGSGGIFTWRSFADIYTTQYQRLVALAPGLPVWVCEFASKEPGEDDGAPVDPTHSKATWYADALSSTSFPAITALVLFDVKKERDWRVASDPANLAIVASAARAAQS